MKEVASMISNSWFMKFSPSSSPSSTSPSFPSKTVLEPKQTKKTSSSPQNSLLLLLHLLLLCFLIVYHHTQVGFQKFSKAFQSPNWRPPVLESIEDHERLKSRQLSCFLNNGRSDHLWKQIPRNFLHFHENYAVRKAIVNSLLQTPPLPPPPLLLLLQGCNEIPHDELATKTSGTDNQRRVCLLVQLHKSTISVDLSSKCPNCIDLFHKVTLSSCTTPQIYPICGSQFQMYE